MVKDELVYIVDKSEDDALPAKEDLAKILRKNEIPTFISKENLNIIKDLYDQLEEENQLKTNVGKYVTELIERNSGNN